MYYSFNGAGLGDAVLRKLRIGATVISGQLVGMDATSQLGNITDPSAADTLPRAVGVTLEGGTYAASTPVDVLTCISPLAVYKAKATNGTTNDTALTVHTGTGTSKTVIAASTVPNVDMSNGTIFCISGANKGKWCIIDTFSNGVSITATNGFENAPVAGDKFVEVPWSLGELDVSLSSTFDQANGGTVAAGTGIDAGIWDVTCDNAAAPTVFVYFSLNDHFANPLS